MNLAVGRLATRAISKAYDIDWHPLQFIPNASLSIAAFLEPAGLKKAAGIITNARSKGWLKPQSKHDPAVSAFLEWMRKYNPDASLRDANNVYGYEVAQTLVEVLKKCGDDLTRGERDEASRQPRSGTRDAPSRNQNYDESDRLSADQAVVSHSVRRSRLGFSRQRDR